MIKKLDKIWFYTALAFAFSIAFRLIWLYQFKNTEAFMWNDQFMINTNDGYFYAEGARDILSGVSQPNDLSPIDTAPSQLTAFFASIFPFSFESIILYMPVFLSSLVVIPILLIAKELQKISVGFIAAILSSIAWSYYNRTMIGYFDTDMLNIVFPTLLLWSLILALKSQEEKYLLFTALEIVAYRWWYPASYSLEFAFLGLVLLYTLVFERKSIYHYKLLAIMLVAMINLPDIMRFSSVIIVFILYKKKILDRYIYYFASMILILFFITGGLTPILAKLQGYVFGESVKTSSGVLQLHFFTVMQTVREAGKIPFEVFANRISGDTITFIFSFLGYIWLCFRHPVMLLGLPMLGLGFLAYVGGLRFTIYAVPILAFGIGFLLVELSGKLSKQFINKKFAIVSKYLVLILATIAILYPNIKHIIGYKVPTVFTKQEVKVLDKLKNISNREDYVVAWWDYGYPIRYYADVKTLIDGGKHSGSVNFPVSFMLTNSQEKAAKLARYDVEYTEKAFKIHEQNRDKKDAEKIRLESNMAEMTKAQGFVDVNDFLNSLEIQDEVPLQTRDIYFYLPFRMMAILPTVAKFSDIDLMNGKMERNPFIFQANRFKDEKEMLHFPNRISFDKKRYILNLQGKKEVAIKTFYLTGHDKNGKLIRKKQEMHKDGELSIIFMRAYNTFLIVDEAMLNSTYIQLFVFENYDKRYFKPVLLDVSAKVFKLKI